MPISGATWATVRPSSIRRHKVNRPIGVSRALACIRASWGRVGVSTAPHCSRGLTSWVDQENQQRSWVLQLVTNVQSSTLISTSRRYRWAVDAYSTYNGTHPRGHYRPGGRSTCPKGPCGRVADENTPSKIGRASCRETEEGPSV